MIKKIALVMMFFAITSLAYADFPIPFDEKLDITTKPLLIKLKDNNTVTVSANAIGGGVPKPLKPFNLNFSFKNVKSIKDVSYITNMTMNMGKYEFIFSPKTVNDHTSSLTLPKCGSGRTKWYGEIKIIYKDNSSETKYIFYDVK